jgi:broad specificity phosphatase PhoE
MYHRVEVLRWREGYDDAGILEGSKPPQTLIQLAAESTLIIASDMPRAIASAERLAPGRKIRTSHLLRETHLHVPRWPTRLPLVAWAALMHGFWRYRMLRGTDASPAEVAQAASAADWLRTVVGEHETAVVVTHGVFRQLLARELLRRGWYCTARTGGYRNWSSWTFR